MDRLCAVITPAYRAAPWVLACVQSVADQEPLEGWRYELRLGVDGCHETSRTLSEGGVGHWWSPVNVGPFLVRNALMREPADAYALFDADDWMPPTYLRSLLPLVGDGIVGAGRKEIDGEGKMRRGAPVRAHSKGVAVYSAAAIQKLGGFRAWPIRADGDMVERAAALRIKIHRTKDVHFLRRIHPGALTQKSGTRLGSPQRQSLERESKRLIKEWKKAGSDPDGLRVTPECAALEWAQGRRSEAAA